MYLRCMGPTSEGSGRYTIGRVDSWKVARSEHLFYGHGRLADLCVYHKSFLYGWYDGITGLVTEPIKGHEEEVRTLRC